MPPSHETAALRIRRTRPISILDPVGEPPVTTALVETRRSIHPRSAQAVSPSSRHTAREKSGWRPSQTTTSERLYDSSEADARVSQDDVPERWDRPFERNADEEFLGPEVDAVPEVDPATDPSLSGSALAAFLTKERRRDLSLADPFSELGGRSLSPRSVRGSSPRVRSQASSPKSPRIGTPRVASPRFEEPEFVRTRSHSSPHISVRSPEPDRRPEAENRRPKYARHGWRPSQASAGDHLYEPPALGDDLPAKWERPFDLHDEYEIDLQKPRPVSREAEETPIAPSAISSFLETERRRDRGSSSAWANQLQEMGSSIRADPHTAAMLTRAASMGREHESSRGQRKGHSRNKSRDGSTTLGSGSMAHSEASRPSRQAVIRAVLDPIPGAVPDCTADGREARRHARRVRQGRADHEDAPPAYMPDRPPVYVEGGTRAKT